MTIKVRAIHECDKPNCQRSTMYAVTFTTHHGQIDGPKVCRQHISWGLSEAKRREEHEDS